MLFMILPGSCLPCLVISSFREALMTCRSLFRPHVPSVVGCEVEEGLSHVSSAIESYSIPGDSRHAEAESLTALTPVVSLEFSCGRSARRVPLLILDTCAITRSIVLLYLFCSHDVEYVTPYRQIHRYEKWKGARCQTINPIATGQTEPWRFPPSRPRDLKMGAQQYVKCFDMTLIPLPPLPSHRTPRDVPSGLPCSSHRSSMRSCPSRRRPTPPPRRLWSSQDRST